MLSAFLHNLLLPPGGLVLLMVLGALARRRFRPAGTVLLYGGAAALYLLATPLVGYSLLRGLDSLDVTSTPAAGAPGPQAIVILSGDVSYHAPEYGGQSVGKLTLERLRRGARLHRLTGLPVLVSGGRTQGAGIALAEAMADALENDFKIPVRWREAKALDTRENAVLSAALLKADGISSVHLVTQAWHMRRAAVAFRAAGLAVHPAPTGFTPWPPSGPVALLPTVRGLAASRRAAYEAAANLWYQFY